MLPVSAAQQAYFRGLFDRSARYSELIKVVESLKIGFGIADPSALSRVLNKQRREKPLRTQGAVQYILIVFQVYYYAKYHQSLYGQYILP